MRAEEKKVADNARRRLLAGSAVLLWPLLAAAAPLPDSAAGCGPEFHGGPPPHGSGPPDLADPPGGLMDDARPPAFLMDVVLSDEQQDKVFAIMHAAAPALRDQLKAARKARQSLRDVVKVAQFSDSTAASLAQAQGRAEGQLALLRTRMEHDIYGVLTPEQTARITAHEHEHEHQGRREGPPRP